MLDYTIILKIGAMGILLMILDKVLNSSGKGEYATVANIAGVIIILITVLGLIVNLFNTVKTMLIL